MNLSKSCNGPHFFCSFLFFFFFYFCVLFLYLLWISFFLFCCFLDFFYYFFTCFLIFSLFFVIVSLFVFIVLSFCFLLFFIWIVSIFGCKFVKKPCLFSISAKLSFKFESTFTTFCILTSCHFCTNITNFVTQVSRILYYIMDFYITLTLKYQKNCTQYEYEKLKEKEHINNFVQ